MEFKSTTSQFSLSRIIKEPTHILSKSISCIDLVVTSQPNLVSDYSVFAKFNVAIFLSFTLKTVILVLSASKNQFY